MEEEEEEYKRRDNHMRSLNSAGAGCVTLLPVRVAIVPGSAYCRAPGRRIQTRLGPSAWLDAHRCPHHRPATPGRATYIVVRCGDMTDE